MLGFVDERSAAILPHGDLRVLIALRFHFLIQRVLGFAFAIHLSQLFGELRPDSAVLGYALKYLLVHSHRIPGHNRAHGRFSCLGRKVEDKMLSKHQDGLDQLLPPQSDTS